MLPIQDSFSASKVAASGDVSGAKGVPVWVAAITVPSRGAAL